MKLTKTLYGERWKSIKGRKGVRLKFEKIRDQNWPIHNSREINCFENVIIKKKDGGDNVRVEL